MTRFTMDLDKATAILNTMEATRPMEDDEKATAIDNLLEYDWSNAEEHQAWLNTATPAEIASWLWELQRN